MAPTGIYVPGVPSVGKNRRYVRSPQQGQSAFNGGKLLLEDAVSFLLLEDGSKLILEP